jgi:hypothetical protein
MPKGANLKITITLIVSLLFFSPAIIARAADPLKNGSEWQQTAICTSMSMDSPTYTIQEAFSKGLVTAELNDENSVMNDLMLKQLCVIKRDIGSINSIKGGKVKYCPGTNGNMSWTRAIAIPFDPITGNQVESGQQYYDWCCPTEYKYMVVINGVDLSDEDNVMCCKSKDPQKCYDSYTWVDKTLTPKQGMVTSAEGQSEENIGDGMKYENSTQLFKWREYAFECAMESCLWKMDTTSNQPQNYFDPRGPFTAVQIRSGYVGVGCAGCHGSSTSAVTQCYPPGKTLSDGTYTCFGGKMWVSGLITGLPEEVRQNVFSNCGGFQSDGEQIACINCYKQSAKFIYNSLGCFDPSQNGLVIRILQIGIGIISVVGIAMIMRAAFLRQTGDPAKIQESWNIITAVVLGLILMLSSIILLKFIGINILQLLPLNFLS